MTNELFLTADGSHSLRSERFGVPYHSVHGAVQESEHVFIDAGLRPLLAHQPDTVTVLEMGMGTGLNVLLTLREALRLPGVHFRYLAFELYPLDARQVGQLNYPEAIPKVGNYLPAIHADTWGRQQDLLPNFTLTKLRADFLGETSGLVPPACADVVYYDAFAPASQPELWTPEAMEKCFEALRPGGCLVTYCAKGQFKRDLRSVGFKVEPLPGPPGKREMTRGRRPD